MFPQRRVHQYQNKTQNQDKGQISRARQDRHDLGIPVLLVLLSLTWLSAVPSQWDNSKIAELGACPLRCPFLACGVVR